MKTNSRFIGKQVEDTPELESKLGAYVGYKTLELFESVDNGQKVGMFVSPHYKVAVDSLGSSVCLSPYLKEKVRKKVNQIFGANAWKHDMLHCSCGFYSYKHIIPAWHHLDMYSNGGVIAKIAVSGMVVDCEKGYRSSLQRVTEIIVLNCNHINTGCTFVPTEFSVFKNDLTPVCSSCAQHCEPENRRTFEEVTQLFSSPDYEPIKITVRPRSIPKRLYEWYC